MINELFRVMHKNAEVSKTIVLSRPEIVDYKVIKLCYEKLGWITLYFQVASKSELRKITSLNNKRPSKNKRPTPTHLNNKCNIMFKANIFKLFFAWKYLSKKCSHIKFVLL